MTEHEAQDALAAALDMLGKVDKLLDSRSAPSWDDLRFSGGASPDYLRRMANEMESISRLRHRIKCFVERFKAC